jgi:hypothetical protein
MAITFNKTTTLKKYFNLKRQKNLIKKGGLTMAKDEIVEEENKQVLEEKLKEALSKIDLKQANFLNEKIASLKSNEPQIVKKEEPKEEVEEIPLTLESAKKNLEYMLLKEYLKDKEKEEIKTFLQEQYNLEETLKEKLEKAFLLKG